MEVSKSHGCICLTGHAIERITVDALSCLQGLHVQGTVSESLQQQTAVELDSCMDEHRAHVTLVTKEELAACTVSRYKLLQGFQRLDAATFFPVGIATVDMVHGAYTDTAASSQSVMKPSSYLRKSSMRGQGGPMQGNTSSQMQPFIGKSSKRFCEIKCLKSLALINQV